jgi:hypothetical protein
MPQGVANVVVPTIGGIPVTGAIARTATNFRAGATTPVAGMVHALTLLAVVLVFAPLARFIPLPTLAAVLFVVARRGDPSGLIRCELALRARTPASLRAGFAASPCACW